MNGIARPKTHVGAIALWSVLGVTVVAIVALVFLKKPPEKKPSVEAAPIPVKTLVLCPRQQPDTIRLPGRIEPNSATRLPAETPGRVTELLADRGDRVKAGQILLRLDDRLWQDTLRRAEIEKREADREFRRWEELKKTGAVSDSSFDAVRIRKETADIAFDEAKVHVSKCDVRSPIDGVVDDRRVEKGEYATEGAPMMTVVDAATVKLIVQVPERDAASIKTGEAIAFTVAALPGLGFTGRVSFVAMQGSPENNAFRTEIRVDNAAGLLKPGMIAEASLTRAIRENALVLPLIAVIPEKGEHVVFVVENGRATRRVVRIESILGNEALIASGVRAGETVVVEGQRALEEGLRVSVVEDGPAIPEPASESKPPATPAS